MVFRISDITAIAFCLCAELSESRIPNNLSISRAQGFLMHDQVTGEGIRFNG
jgi:hypothetical protein